MVDMQRGVITLSAAEATIVTKLVADVTPDHSDASLPHTPSLAQLFPSPAPTTDTTYELDENETETIIDLLPPPSSDTDPQLFSLRQKFDEFLKKLRGVELKPRIT